MCSFQTKQVIKKMYQKKCGMSECGEKKRAQAIVCVFYGHFFKKPTTGVFLIVFPCLFEVVSNKNLKFPWTCWLFTHEISKIFGGKRVVAVFDKMWKFPWCVFLLLAIWYVQWVSLAEKLTYVKKCGEAKMFSCWNVYR